MASRWCPDRAQATPSQKRASSEIAPPGSSATARSRSDAALAKRPCFSAEKPDRNACSAGEPVAAPRPAAAEPATGRDPGDIAAACVVSRAGLGADTAGCVASRAGLGAAASAEATAVRVAPIVPVSVDRVRREVRASEPIVGGRADFASGRSVPRSGGLTAGARRTCQVCPADSSILGCCTSRTSTRP